MYRISKTFEVSASHSLALGYDSPCRNLHGHNWKIRVWCRSEKLNQEGMVIDFKTIKDLVHFIMDHKNLNDIFDFNPTAENIAKWITDQISESYRVDVMESEGNWASYEKSL